jgi:hypothetical protein
MAQGERAGHYVLRRNAVIQIHDLSLWIDAGDDAFHDSYEGIFVTEVGRQSNDHGAFHVGMNLTEKS